MNIMIKTTLINCLTDCKNYSNQWSRALLSNFKINAAIFNGWSRCGASSSQLQAIAQMLLHFCCVWMCLRSMQGSRLYIALWAEASSLPFFAFVLSIPYLVKYSFKSISKPIFKTGINIYSWIFVWEWKIGRKCRPIARHCTSTCSK